MAFIAGEAEAEECCELGPTALVCSENENQQKATNKNGFSFRYSFSSNSNPAQNAKANELLTRVIARLPANQKQQMLDFNLEMPCFGFECSKYITFFGNFTFLSVQMGMKEMQRQLDWRILKLRKLFQAREKSNPAAIAAKLKI